MNTDEIGWAHFFNEAMDFSDAFGQQMSEQLRMEFDAALGIKNASKRGFLLFVGMEDMNVTYLVGGRAQAQVEICCPNSSAIVVTAYWKIKDATGLLVAMKNDSFTGDNIEFGWCDDFDKEHFLQFFTPKNVLSKGTNGLAFDVEYNFELYPDLSLAIFCKEKFDAGTLKQMQQTIIGAIPGAYVSEINAADDR